MEGSWQVGHGEGGTAPFPLIRARDGFVHDFYRDGLRLEGVEGLHSGYVRCIYRT